MHLQPGTTKPTRHTVTLLLVQPLCGEESSPDNSASFCHIGIANDQLSTAVHHHHMQQWLWATHYSICHQSNCTFDCLEWDRNAVRRPDYLLLFFSTQLKPLRTLFITFQRYYCLADHNGRGLNGLYRLIRRLQTITVVLQTWDFHSLSSHVHGHKTNTWDNTTPVIAVLPLLPEWCTDESNMSLSYIQ